MLIAGNWKMYKTAAETAPFCSELAARLRGVAGVAGVDVVVCPPYTSLVEAVRSLRGAGVGVFAQNVHWAREGAFTGEVSAEMLRALGVAGSIVGHSERRQYFAETDETVNKKVRAAVEHDLVPIICVGENLVQREAGETLSLVSGQVRAALDGLTAEQVADAVIAYEPVWAIGTGRAATPEDANAVIGHIRALVAEGYGALAGATVRIQYGGSVTAGNITALMAMPEIDGALVGGASLNAADFIRIAEVAARTRTS